MRSEPGPPPGSVLRTLPPSPPLCGGRVSALAVGDPISGSVCGLAKRRACSGKRRCDGAITSAVLAAIAVLILMARGRMQRALAVIAVVVAVVVTPTLPASFWDRMMTIVDDTFQEGHHDLQEGMCSRKRHELAASRGLWEITYGRPLSEMPTHGCTENLSGPNCALCVSLV